MRSPDFNGCVFVTANSDSKDASVYIHGAGDRGLLPSFDIEGALYTNLIGRSYMAK